MDKRISVLGTCLIHQELHTTTLLYMNGSSLLSRTKYIQEGKQKNNTDAGKTARPIYRHILPHLPFTMQSAMPPTSKFMFSSLWQLVSKLAKSRVQHRTHKREASAGTRSVERFILPPPCVSHKIKMGGHSQLS